MAKGKFYHVYLLPKAGIQYSDIEKKMNLALDWFKYDKNNWVVYSSASLDTLITRFKPLAEKEGRVFICELNIKSRNGWMDKDFWAWIRQNQNR